MLYIHANKLRSEFKILLWNSPVDTPFKSSVLKHINTDSIKIRTFYEARFNYLEFVLIQKAETQCKLAGRQP